MQAGYRRAAGGGRKGQTGEIGRTDTRASRYLAGLVAGLMSSAAFWADSTGSDFNE